MEDVRHEGPEQGDPTRRRFLALAIGILASLNALVLGIPFVGSLISAASKKGKGAWVKVADVGSLPENEPVELKFSSLTKDAFHYEQVLHSVWVVKHAPERVSVFSPICPHLGCHFIWKPGTERFACPCHASVFSMGGKVLYGPAPRPLDLLPARINNGALYVQWQRFRVGTPQKIVV